MLDYRASDIWTVAGSASGDLMDTGGEGGAWPPHIAPDSPLLPPTIPEAVEARRGKQQGLLTYPPGIYIAGSLTMSAGLYRNC